MRSMLFTLGTLALLVATARAADLPGESNDLAYPSVRNPEDVFAPPPAERADAPLTVPPAAVDEIPAEAIDPAFVPPVPLQPPVNLESGASPRPFNFEMSSRGMTWLPGDGDRLGIFTLDGPAGDNFAQPQAVTAGLDIAIHFLDGPSRTDLPPRLFEFSLFAGWRDQIDDQWAYEILVAPGIFADFEDSAREGVRILGHGIVWYEPSPENLWAFGVVSLDRETISVLPVLGLVHRPDERTRFELLFPRPRVARRISSSSDSRAWVYLAGEYGGGSWAIERLSGREDVLTLNDKRLILGVEWCEDDSPGPFFEVGYVFDREVRYRSGRRNYDAGDALMLRSGTRF